MTALQADGRLLLPEDDAAREAGVTVETLRSWAASGLLVQVPCYDPAAVRSLLSRMWQVPDPGPRYVSPQQAAIQLGVGVPTLTRKAGEGCVGFIRTLEGHRRYDASVIRAIAAKRREPGCGNWWPDPPKTS